jgi:murein L,D-transpeptidase YcbB/YkuD
LVRYGICLGFILAQPVWGPVLAQAPDVPTTLEAEFRTVSAGAHPPGALELRAWEGPQEVLEFYARREFAPAWEDPERLRHLTGALGSLIDDGLDPRDYDLPALEAWLRDTSSDPMALIEVELRATGALLRALRHLTSGRLDPGEAEAIWMHRPARDEARQRARVMELASAALEDVSAAFSSARPDAELYAVLRETHADLRREILEPEAPMIPGGALLREGSLDPRVPALRERLGQIVPGADAGPASMELYGPALVAAVKAFQRSHGLEIDGIVGPDTLEALNRSRQERLDQVRVNLERLRWVSALTPTDLVRVDLAGGAVDVLRDGESIWHARVQIGRPARPSPSLLSEITHLTFNPAWTVPPTILREDTLPTVRRDPDFLERNRMRVFDGSGRELSADAVDWDQPTGIVLRQDPGPFNALGKVAIRFHNPFLVFLHDTPSQGLFEREQRAFSSGCVRVERARELVEVLLRNESETRRREAIRLLEGDETRDFHLARPMPILMIYRTVGLGTEGELVFRPDVYQRDAALARALDEAARQ